MRVFIVHAHPEWKSFNGALTREAVRALTAAGHDVTVSDLYRIGFNPVLDRRNFVTVKDAEFYRQQNEEAYAATHDGFAQGHTSGSGQAFLVRCPDPTVSSLVVRAASDSQRLGR
jgi:hypothetical protein